MYERIRVDVRGAKQLHAIAKQQRTRVGGAVVPTSSAAMASVAGPADEVTVAGAPKLVEASVAAGRKFDGGLLRRHFK
mgnify:CR=1 FL=1